MRCINCGARLEDNAAFCAECGSPRGAARPEYGIPPKPKKRGKTIAIAAIALAVVVLGAAAYFVAPKLLPSSDKPLTADELLDLGEKYLLDLDYEQAIVYFEQLVEVEPKNPRGYTGLAEAYEAQGETAKAERALKRGLRALPDDEELLAAQGSPEEDAAPEKPGGAEQVNNSLIFLIGNPNMLVNGVSAAIDDNGGTPRSVGGTTMLPLRGVVTAMGGTAEYDGETGTVRVTLGDVTADIVPGSGVAYINGAPEKLAAAPAAVGGSMLAPARFIASLVNGDVVWDGNTKSVTLTYTGAAIDTSALTERQENAAPTAATAPTPVSNIPSPAPPVFPVSF
ncbi:MAG: tetratricopeptide repeat protein [Oscillospiraceae bacterium]|jgi:hypothetical protein|nr:tetratricopeptide repeat protein [Oscillospiraceae bacterium]